jgi:GTP-binding protein
MPQTRFVLQKAVDLGLKPIVVINKVDKPNCDPEATNEAVFELMFSLDASEEQLDYPLVYGSSKHGWMGPDFKNPTQDVSYLLDTILEHIPAPEKREGTLQLQISSLDYSSYKGRIAVGRVHRGSIVEGDRVSIVQRNGEISRAPATEL